MRVLPLLQEVRGWEENSDYPLPLKDSGSQALPQVPPTPHIHTQAHTSWSPLSSE